MGLVCGQNGTYEGIKSRLNSGNVWYHSVQNILSSRLLYKNFEIKKYKTTILRVALYGCETWHLTLREEHRLRVFENMVPRIFGRKEEEVAGGCKRLHNEELYNLYASPDVIKVIISRRMNGRGI
jgi:hypothetical protein